MLTYQAFAQKWRLPTDLLLYVAYFVTFVYYLRNPTASRKREEIVPRFIPGNPAQLLNRADETLEKTDQTLARVDTTLSEVASLVGDVKGLLSELESEMALLKRVPELETKLDQIHSLLDQ